MRIIVRWTKAGCDRVKFEYFGGLDASRKKAVADFSEWCEQKHLSGVYYKVEKLVDSSDLTEYRAERFTESLLTHRYIEEDLIDLFHKMNSGEISNETFKDTYVLLSLDLANHLSRISRLFKYLLNEVGYVFSDFQVESLKDLGMIEES